MVKSKLQRHLLYFHAGIQPTESDIEMAYSISHNVGFRSSIGGKNLQSIEKADAVAGEVPLIYKGKLPVVSNAEEFAALFGPVTVGTVSDPLPQTTVQEPTKEPEEKSGTTKTQTAPTVPNWAPNA